MILINDQDRRCFRDGQQRGNAFDKNNQFQRDENGKSTDDNLRRGKSPYKAAHGTRKIVWTFGTGLRTIPVHGKNYETHK